VEKQIPHDAYADALIAEFEARRDDLAGRDVRTIYFGGGTPSLWSIEAFERVLGHLMDAVDRARIEEVTLEANPVDMTVESLERWAGAGVTRLSIGVQSFQSAMLDALNRNHSADQARRAVELALEHGPGLVSFDLMFGVPGQSEELWARDLELIDEFEGLAHVSGYNLTIEPGTAFYRRRERGRLELPDDDASFGMLEMLVDTCADAGLERYEVSNFAREGARSRHNTLYWTGAEYLGIGTGAHSLRIDERGVVRRANPRSRTAYTEAPVEPMDVERLDAGQHFVERLFLGLRTREGVDWQQVRDQFDAVLPPEQIERARRVLESFVEQGWVEFGERTFRPTRSGLNVADALADKLISEIDA
jgi:oxygen-independent coproporphyrinogen-3 oxidase